MFNFRSVIGVFLAFLLLGERVSLLQIELIIVVFLSSLVVTFDEKWSLKSFFNRGVVLLLLAVVNLSLYGIYLNKSIALNNFWATTVFVPLISQALLLMTLPLFRKEIKTVNPKSLGAVGIMSVLGTFGTLAGNAALAKNVSISTVIISVPVSMILAFIFSLVAPELLEKHPIGVYAVRFLAAFVMISAPVKLSLM
jgi:drug/metabolite transporter (DMT)-like permease